MSLWRKVACCLGVISMCYGAMVCIGTTFSLGNALSFFVGAVFFCYGLWYPAVCAHCQEGWKKRFHRLFQVALVLFLSSLCFCTGLLLVTGKEQPPQGADVVLVLGAGLNKDQVSLSLAYRLDAAFDYYLQNPGCKILVSGGQGPNEWVTEGSAMKQYLLEKGVPESDLWVEEQSSRTMENFLFSKPIIEAAFPQREAKVVYVTNGFHVFRAGCIASQTGYEAHGLGAKTVFYLAPAQYLREYFSLLNFFTFDQLFYSSS